MEHSSEQLACSHKSHRRCFFLFRNAFSRTHTQRGGSPRPDLLQLQHERRYADPFLRRPRRAVWKPFHLLSRFPASRDALALRVTLLVRRHFYYSASRRRFDAPRRLCKRDAAFAAFFSYVCTQEKTVARKPPLIIKDRVSQSSVSDFRRTVYRNARFKKFFYTAE